MRLVSLSPVLDRKSVGSFFLYPAKYLDGAGLAERAVIVAEEGALAKNFMPRNQGTAAATVRHPWAANLLLEALVLGMKRARTVR
jgi:hypothetical protein